MAYNDNIPAASDLISKSQGQIQANFQAIDSTLFGFARNHIALTDGTNGGLHNRIDFYQSIPTPPAVSGFVSALYPQNIFSTMELCYTNTNGVNNQITSNNLDIWKGGGPGGTGVVTTTNSGNGALNFPNGIQFRWGSTAVNTGGTPVTYSSAFTNATYSVTLTPQSNASRGAAVGSLTENGFTAYSENNGTTMYYFAVGH